LSTLKNKKLSFRELDNLSTAENSQLLLVPNFFVNHPFSQKFIVSPFHRSGAFSSPGYLLSQQNARAACRYF
jgi:hypothetical protein